jgi:hypothetical protein
MYGAIRGIIGAKLPEIPALDLEAIAPAEDSASSCEDHSKGSVRPEVLEG